MEKICAKCACDFATNRGWQRFCSPECAGRQRAVRYRARRPKKLVAITCRWCKSGFEHHDLRRDYCSADCARFGALLSEVFRKYGITKDEYRDMWFAQDGRCAVCQKPERTSRCALLAVDHDHVTGAVRGLLCSFCNRAIGMFDDDPAVLARAIKYLEHAALIAA
jgi:hypothetical protein